MIINHIYNLLHEKKEEGESVKWLKVNNHDCECRTFMLKNDSESESFSVMREENITFLRPTLSHSLPLLLLIFLYDIPFKEKKKH